jgi:hypothetical protein
MNTRQYARIAGQYAGLVEVPGARQGPAIRRSWQILSSVISVMIGLGVALALRSLHLPDPVCLLAVVVLVLTVNSGILTLVRRRANRRYLEA